jgi:tetratricopeptide (TPR) repeat protein
MGKRSIEKPAHDSRESDATSLRAWLDHPWLPGALLFVLVLIVYSPICWAGFIWDDDFYVTGNAAVIEPGGLVKIWTTHLADICPLVMTTFWIEHQLWGLNPLGFHLVNVAIHGTSAIVLWRLLRALEIPGAWLGAALWALHPVLVESVAWVAELKNTQSTFFYLLALLFFCHWLKTARRSDYGLALLFTLFAMASKTSTMILPLVFVLEAWWVDRRWSWSRVFALVPAFMLSVAAGLLSVWTQGAKDHGLWAARGFPERLITAGNAIWFYIGKLVVPYPLMTIYPRWQIDAANPLGWLPLLAVVAALLLFLIKRNSWGRWWFFTLAYFIAALLPVLGLVEHGFIRYSFVADHFQNLAAIAPLALAAAGLVRLEILLDPLRKKLMLIAVTAVVIVFAGITWTRVWAYQNEYAIWTDELAKNPATSLAYNKVGCFLSAKGQNDAAIENFHKALALDPNSFEALDNLGFALTKEGRTDEAIADYKKALQIKPDYLQTLINWGDVLMLSGQLDQALALFQKALDVAPESLQALNNIGMAYLQKGDVNKAREKFQQALADDSDFDEAWYNLGQVDARTGDVDGAISNYRRAVEIYPDYVDARASLGNALFQAGQIDEAVTEYQRALAVDPKCYEALNNLGLAYLRLGQLDDAVKELKQAIAVYPNGPEVHDSFGLVLSKLGRTQEAIAEFRIALQLEPDYAVAQRNLLKAQGSATSSAGGE